MHSPAYSTVIPFYFTYISYTCICTPRPSAHIHLPYPLALTVCIPRFSSTSCQFPTFCLSTPSTSPTLNLVYLHVILPCPLPCLSLCFFLLHSSSSHHIPLTHGAHVYRAIHIAQLYYRPLLVVPFRTVTHMHRSHRLHLSQERPLSIPSHSRLQYSINTLHT